MEKKFTTIFINFKKIHLNKSVGMIPVSLSENHGYFCSILTFKDENYLKIEKSAPNVRFLYLKKRKFYKLYEKYTKLFFIKRLKKFFHFYETLSIILDNFILLKNTLNETDILNLFQLRVETLIFGTLYRIIRKKNKKLYIKLDVAYNDNYLENEKKSRFFLWNIADILLSTEIYTSEMYKFAQIIRSNFKTQKPKSIFYIPNGINFSLFPPEEDFFSNKENIILHVAANIGSYQKASENIINPFLELSDQYPEWKLYLIGNIDKDYLKNFDKIKSSNIFNKNIFHLGYISSRKKLFDLYKKSRILAIPSRDESFGFVTIEASYFGNVILGSDIIATKILTNYGKNAFLCRVDDIECFKEKLKYIYENKKILVKKNQGIIEYYKKNFDWVKIINKLNKIFYLC